MTLLPTQVLALRELEQVWPESRIVIIGATALGFYYEMSWRQTADVDLVVAVELAELDELANRAGWQQHPRKQHEFRSPDDVKLDVLPAGAQILEQGEIIWPGGHVMNMAGIELAFGHAASHDLDGFVAQVAPPTVVALLKMTAYLDRPNDRLRDLADIAHLLDIYVEDDSERRWDEAVDVEEFELAPAYLFGLDVGKIVEDSHHALIRSFLDRVADPEGVEHAQMKQRGPSRWNGQLEPLERRLDAFKTGLNRSGARGQR